MSDRLQEIARKRKQAHSKLLALRSKTYQAFLDMEKAAYEAPFPRKRKS